MCFIFALEKTRGTENKSGRQIKSQISKVKAVGYNFNKT